MVRYGDLTAVDGVSLRARAGEVLAVLGPNGAGKTSTVEVLEGFRRPSGGRVRVLGLDPLADHRQLVGDTHTEASQLTYGLMCLHRLTY